MHYGKTITGLLILLAVPLYGQEELRSFEEKLAQLEAEMDSLSIFFLLDSVLETSYEKYSELNTRLSYNSNVLSAGRNYGLNQHGISPGLSFYHKSGFFTDYVGFWSNNLSPKYNLSIFSAGYLGSMDRWTYSASYERWVYHDSQADPSKNLLRNSLGGSVTYNTKIGYATIDYSYLFGDGENAHRIIGSLTGTISLGKWWVFNSIRILPSFSTFFGNQEVIIRFEGSLLDELKTNEYLRQNIDSQTLLSLLTEEERQQIQSIRQRNTDGKYSRFQQLRILNIYLSNEDVVNYLYDLLDEEKDQYGIMNYSFSLPVMFSVKNFSFMLNYTYSIPVQLPGEEIDLDPIGYLGAAVTYRIPFRK